MVEPGGRVLALDLGEVRIGVAVSDPDRMLSLPAGTIKASGGVEDLKAVARMVAETGAVEVVVGHPLSLSGERGPSAHKAEEFAEGLRLILKVPVHLQDERLSTVQAEKGLREAGAGARERRRVVDRAAASIILEAYLARAPSEREAPTE
ncbi:MAG: Holliday junction resolvase RuvX [Actinomycetota bacterium]